MTRSFLTRVATSALGLALIVLAAGGIAPSAYADDPVVLTPTTPTTLDPAPVLPDLVVKFEKISCSLFQEGGVHLLFQVRIINMANVPANGTWQTDVKLDGVMALGAPKQTTGPLWATTVYQFNIPNMTPGLHVLTAFTDSTLKVAESNEGNNKAAARVYCP
jgi:CARDB protein